MKAAKTLAAVIAVGSLAWVFGVLSPAFAAREGGIGNGGGAWVCREPSGTIRWSKLVDLFEATDEFGLSLAQYRGATNDIVDQVMLRVSRANQDLHEALAPYVESLVYLESNSPKVTYTDDVLQTIDDSLYRLKPSLKRCTGGSVNYEQVVNYKQDGLILVGSEIFNSLPASAKAALVFHEAIYKYRRDVVGDTNSVTTRRIVGLIFSTLSADDLKKALADLGENEVNATGMKFVSIRPGAFVMGSPNNEEGRYGDEKLHEVTLSQGFEMQVTDVTQAQWVKVMKSNPSFFQSAQYCPKTFKRVNGVSMCPNNPVEQVSYDDVQIFISKLNSARTDEYFYRLPTEAEWEYAARAGSSSAYFFGDSSNLLYQYAWFFGNSGGQTHEVAQLKPNANGLYDMAGNVDQWVADWFSDDYGADTVQDPTGPDSSSYRVTRGGSWRDGRSGARGFRAAVRYYSKPDFRVSAVGFRLVRMK